MKKSPRHITSLLMTLAYLLIVLSPLAPLAMQSKLITHAVTGECSGDCRIDGCAQERSAAHTCCCWQKKKNNARKFFHHPKSEYGLAQPPSGKKVRQQGASCCAVIPAGGSYREESTPASDSKSQQKGTTEISSTPCGNGTLFTLSSTDITQHLPCFFAKDSLSANQYTLTFPTPDRLTSRYGEPPDPPPIIKHTS